MTVLKKYVLDYDKAHEFFTAKDKNNTLLAASVIEKTPFSEGVFYTILKDRLSSEQLHQFNGGDVGGEVLSKLVDLVYKELDERECFFLVDDFDAKFTKLETWDLLNKVGGQVEDEFFYLIDKQTNSKDLIKECFLKSDTQWHSLSVISPKTKPYSKKWKKADMLDYCSSADYLFMLAYDDEGYIIWERNKVQVE